MAPDLQANLAAYDRAKKTKRTPYRVTCALDLFTLWHIRGGLAFIITSGFTMDELATCVAARGLKPISMGIPLKILAAI